MVREAGPVRIPNQRNVCAMCLGELSEALDDENEINLHPGEIPHIFHRLCVQTWIAIHHNCPVCLRAVNIFPIVRPAIANPPLPQPEEIYADADPVQQQEPQRIQRQVEQPEEPFFPPFLGRNGQRLGRQRHIEQDLFLADAFHRIHIGPVGAPQPPVAEPHAAPNPLQQLNHQL